MKTLPSTGSSRNTAMLGLAALVLLGMVGVSYHEWRGYNTANQEAAQTREIVDSVNVLLSSLIDAEAGQRGFLLTGEERYLEPYNLATGAIPDQLAHLKSLLATRPGESANVVRLDSLVDQKLTELRNTIELRGKQGPQAALDAVLSDQGKRVMDETRALGAEIQRQEISAQGQPSAEGQVAAGSALLATVAGSLVLLFIFAFGMEPFASPEPQAWRRSWPLRYGAAVLAVVAIALLRGALTPLIGRTNLPFTLFFCAVAFAAWYGGFRPAVLSIALSLLTGAYFFAKPIGSFWISDRDDQVATLMLIVVGFGIALLSRAQRSAVDRALQAEDSERSLRQRFETTLASIGDAVIVTDAVGRITFANKIALSLMRRTESEIAGKHLDEVFRIVNELTRAKVESPVAKVMREGSIVGLANHTVLIALDGTETPIDDSAAPIRAADGSVQGTVLVFRDVTARRHAEATSRLLASVVESSDDAIMSVDLNGVVTSWNKGAERTFGYSAGEMIGQPILSLAAPETVDDFLRIPEQIKKGEFIEHYETVRRTKQGELINVSVTTSPVRDAMERIVGVSRVARDITERVRAEERMRLIVEAAPNAMIMVARDGSIEFVNSQTEKLLGYQREELLGQSVETLIPERYRAGHGALRASFLREALARPMGAGRDLFGLRKDGREVPIEIGLSPISTSQGDFVLAAIIDISERVRAAERVEQLNADLQNSVQSLALANKDLERFAFVASHDLQEPLRMITAYAQLLVKNYPGEADQEATTCVANIVDGTRRMRELLADLLAYTEIGARLEEPLEAVDLNQVIESVR